MKLLQPYSNRNRGNFTSTFSTVHTVGRSSFLPNHNVYNPNIHHLASCGSAVQCSTFIAHPFPAKTSSKYGTRPSKPQPHHLKLVDDHSSKTDILITHRQLRKCTWYFASKAFLESRMEESHSQISSTCPSGNGVLRRSAHGGGGGWWREHIITIVWPPYSTLWYVRSINSTPVIYHIIHGNARLRQKMETGEQICFSQTFIIPVAFLGRDTDDWWRLHSFAIAAGAR